VDRRVTYQLWSPNGHFVEVSDLDHLARVLAFRSRNASLAAMDGTQIYRLERDQLRELTTAEMLVVMERIDCHVANTAERPWGVAK
jgi:hypothetical protein